MQDFVVPVVSNRVLLVVLVELELDSQYEILRLTNNN